MKNFTISIFLKKHWISILVISSISLLFFVLYCFVVRYLTSLSVSSFLPGFSDMVDYYNETNTAIQIGIFSHNAGYNGFIWTENTLSVASSLFYGAHGVFILLPYILFGSIIGWGGASPLIIHTILLTIAFYFVYFCSGSLKKTIVIQGLCYSFIPLLIYFSSMMMEIQMYAWSVISMALYYAYVTRPSRMNHIGLFVAVVFASAVRITNVVFLIPYFVLKIRDFIVDKPARKHTLQDLFMGAVSFLAIAVLYIAKRKLSAPYHDNFLSELLQALTRDEGALYLFNEHFIESLHLYFDFGFDSKYMLLFILLRYAVFGLAMILAIQFFISFKKLKKRGLRSQNIEPLGLSLVLFGIALLNIMLYDVFDWRDFRVMAPVFFAIVVYIILRYRKFAAVAHVSVTLCLAFLMFLSIPISRIEHRFGEFHHNEVSKYMHYDPNAETRYGNTIVDSGSIDTLYDIEAGLGIVVDFAGYTTEEMSRLGVKYIITDYGTNLEVDGFYDRIASGDNYVLYELKQSSKD